MRKRKRKSQRKRKRKRKRRDAEREGGREGGREKRMGRARPDDGASKGRPKHPFIISIRLRQVP